MLWSTLDFIIMNNSAIAWRLYLEILLKSISDLQSDVAMKSAMFSVKWYGTFAICRQIRMCPNYFSSLFQSFLVPFLNS